MPEIIVTLKCISNLILSIAQKNYSYEYALGTEGEIYLWMMISSFCRHYDLTSAFACRHLM